MEGILNWDNDMNKDKGQKLEPSRLAGFGYVEGNRGKWVRKDTWGQDSEGL